ncbi:UNVERIFIED_ORG: CHASE3 domain sensor protein/GAF domain-containing protein [Pseudomonas reinekei]|nr:CHASE3 domain sensor protein/GAF domain-containing protein [Pseudomonas reinekei]
MTSASSVDEQRFRKLLSRNISLPLGLGLISAVFFVSLITYLLSTIQWVEHTDRVINNANEAVKLTVDLETGMRGFLLSGDEHFLDPYETAKPRIAVALNTLLELTADNPVQTDRLLRLQALQLEWTSYAQSMIDLQRSSGDYRSVVKAGRGKRLTDEIRKQFEEVIDTEQQLRTTRNDEVRRTTVWSISLYLLFIAGVSGLLAYVGRRDLLSLSQSYSVNLAAQQASAHRLEQQAWLRNGQTELAEQVLGQLSLNLLGRNILQFCAQYLGTAVAALYVREDHGGLRRIATYGFSREQEEREQQIYSDEGIVGQVAQQARLIRLDEVPGDYFKVCSGLGDGLPRSVLVVPTSDDDRVNGVIELGFLRPLDDRDVALLELIASNIGTSIEAARYRQRLQEVLAETQQLNEELQVQQEEAQDRQRRARRTVAGAQGVPGAPGNPAGGAGADQRTTRRAGRGAGRATRRHGPEELRTQSGADPARRTRAGAAAFEQVQVRISRQHVPRTAHAAQQLVDPGQAAGGKPGRKPHGRASEVRRVDLLRRQ